MKCEFHSDFQSASDVISEKVRNFETTGTVLVKGKRNTIKLFPHDPITLNVKSFKRPNLVNTIIYRFFRKSKAQRSFEYANLLLSKGIGTPQPIAYFENYGFLGVADSYYVSQHLQSDLLFRDLTKNPDIPDAENILRQFTRFTWDLHRNGIEFKDHSPGNTLIKNEGNGHYSFYLVDLNRMNFHTNMPLRLRMKNMSRLTSKPELLTVMANEYSKASGENEKLVLQVLTDETKRFHDRFYRKKRIKNKLRMRK